MIKAVFFDVGSTLIDPNPDIDGVFYEVSKLRGHNVEKEQISENLTLVNQFYEEEYLRDGDFWCSPQGSVEIYLEMYRYLSHLVGLAHDAEGLAQQVHARYLRPDYWSIFDDVIPCLKELKHKHIRLGVVSNWAPNLRDLLRDLRISPYFEDIISSADVGYRKPDPMIFTILLERLQLKPDEVLHVGDRPDADAAGAIAAGIKPVIIDRKGSERNCGHTCIGSLSELSSTIASFSFL